MKKFVLILCVLGFIFLIVGGVLAFPPIQTTIIRCSGTIVHHPEESQSQYKTRLDQLGYLTIFTGIGFFIASFLYNRRSVKSL